MRIRGSFMSDQQTSNVVPFKLPSELRDNLACEDDVVAEDTVADMRAVARCLEYLYRESSRLEAGTSTRLIGAAVLAIHQDIQRARAQDG